MTNKVLFIGSFQDRVEVPTSVSTWGQLKAHVTSIGKNVDFTSLTATDGSNKTVYGHEDSILNVVDGKVRIYVAPSKGFKGGANYDFDYSVEDVADLDYADLKQEIKNIRLQATELEDETTLTLIGNYTNLSTAARRAKLIEVYTALDNVETPEVNVDLTDVEARLNTIEAEQVTMRERLTALELGQGLLNEFNGDAFTQWAEEFGNSLT